MRLLTVLGASKISSKQKYIYEGKRYEEYFSFLALQKALGIESVDTVVVGTDKTKALLKEFSPDEALLKNFREVDDGVAIDDFFRLCLELIQKDTYLDVTQGFRHMPMTLLLSSLTAVNFTDKNIKDILYAKTLDSSCQPSNAVCSFEFYSMLSYLDMASIAASIDSFCASYSAPATNTTYQKFESIYDSLGKLSRHLVGNNLAYASEIAKDIKPKLEPLRLSPLSPLLPKLDNEIDFLIGLERMSEHERFFEGAKRYFQKELFLNSVTTLFEAVTAFLDYIVTRDRLTFVFTDKKTMKPFAKTKMTNTSGETVKKKLLRLLLTKIRVTPSLTKHFQCN